MGVYDVEKRNYNKGRKSKSRRKGKEQLKQIFL